MWKEIGLLESEVEQVIFGIADWIEDEIALIKEKEPYAVKSIEALRTTWEELRWNMDSIIDNVHHVGEDEEDE